MLAEHYRKVDEIVQQAFDLTPTEQDALLADKCDGDPTLRQEVEALLDADREASSLLGRLDHESPRALHGPIVDLLSPVEPGRLLGPYRIVELIGRGGMAEVFLAERADGRFERQVAIKILPPHRGGQHWAARFLREQQILGQLEHPHVARLLDGGVTGGRPYFVLEYVPGMRLDRHCDELALGIRQRVDRLAQVCEAVGFAHRNLIVHRDLKPSNILVDKEGQVKLLDFGIAKLLDPDASPGPDLTLTGQRLMTPQYASPEQFLDQPVTTASDVYSLGVVLYELLTGHRPYALDDLSATEIERCVCEQPIHLPSRVASAEGAARAPFGEVASSHPRRALEGDLDAIVSKALEKRPADRYPSCLELADDLRRFLDGRPVRAQTLTVGYRLRKAVRRHATAIGLGLGISAILLASAAAFRLQAERLHDERQAFHQERQRAEKVSGFLIDMVGQSDPDQAQGDPLTAVEVLERSRRTVDQLADQPRLHAMLLEQLGSVYLSLGRPDLADEHLVAALAVNRRLGDVSETADVLETLASVRSNRADFDTALHLAREALALRRQDVGEHAPPTIRAMRTLATMHLARGDDTDAEAWLERGLELSRQRIDGPTLDAAEILHQLGTIASHQRHLDLAELYLLQARGLIRLTQGESHPDLATTDNDLGVVRALAGRKQEAVVAFQKALDLRRRVLGENHPRILKTSTNLASLLVDLGRAEEAEPLLRETLARRLELFGAEHPHVMHSHLVLGHALRDLDRLDEAEASLRAAERIAGTLPERHIGRSFPALGLGRVLTERRPTEAEQWFRQALAIRLATLPETHVLVADARMHLGLHQMRHGQHDEARDLLLAAERGLAGTAKTAEHQRTVDALEALAGLDGS